MGGLLFYIAIIIAAVVFLPLFLSLNLYYDVHNGKCAFVLTLMKVIKIGGGYITSYDEGLALHKTNRKALLIPYSKMNDERKKFSVIKTFHFKSLVVNVQSSADNFYILNFLQRILSILKLCNNKFENTSLRLTLTNENCLKITARCVFRFNLFIVLLNFIEFVGRKIKNLCQQKTKKSTI